MIRLHLMFTSYCLLPLEE